MINKIHVKKYRIYFERGWILIVYQHGQSELKKTVSVIFLQFFNVIPNQPYPIIFIIVHIKLKHFKLRKT